MIDIWTKTEDGWCTEMSDLEANGMIKIVGEHKLIKAPNDLNVFLADFKIDGDRETGEFAWISEHYSDGILTIFND